MLINTASMIKTMPVHGLLNLLYIPWTHQLQLVASFVTRCNLVAHKDCHILQQMTLCICPPRQNKRIAKVKATPWHPITSALYVIPQHRSLH
jgi:hypothetical protein